ncbi:MAG: AI-2E family transporter [Erysipelotrichaceae bacterium]|nr:AI-2E family transporter [Erysipelotrichaceae bacterium]MDD3808664.1 AI-2E family transporter [Erysipelotrichaceae bacterium]
MKFIRKLIEYLRSKNLMQVGINVAIVLLSILLIQLNLNFFNKIFSTLFAIARPFLFGGIIAFILEPLIGLANKFFKSRNACVALVYTFLLIGIIVLISYSIPVFYMNIVELLPSFNSGLMQVQDLILKYLHLDISSIISQIQNDISKILTNDVVINTTIGIFNQVISVILGFIIYFIIGIYVSIYYKKVKLYMYRVSFFIDRKMPRYVLAINESLHKWLIAFFITALYQGLVTAIMYLMIGNENFIILGILSGLTSIIPYFGPVFINILGLILSLNLGIVKVVILLFLILIQSNIFGYVVVPKIYSKRINLGIFEILFAILTGNTLIGPLGILISIPVLVAIKTIHDIYTTKSQKSSA